MKIIQEESKKTMKQLVKELDSNDPNLRTSALGRINERFVVSFFERICYDHNLPIKVSHADIYEDAGLSVDLVLEIKEENKRRFVGLQFTTSTNEDVINKKENRIKKLMDDGRLENSGIEKVNIVRTPARELIPAAQLWDLSLMKRGMDRFIRQDVLEDIFKQALDGIIDMRELYVTWDDISEDYETPPVIKPI